MQRLITLGALVAMCGGCSGGPGVELAPVTGKVTLNGEPLAGARISFGPQGGRPSTAVVGPDGTYELEYTPGYKGAVVGRHTVVISKMVEPDPSRRQVDEYGNPLEEGSITPQELLPPQYNAATQLSAEVKPGGGPYDFELSS